MKRLLAFLFTISIAAVLSAAAWAETPPPVPGTTVAITNCGRDYRVTVGSSAFAGSVEPGTRAVECRVWFTNPDPFNVIVDGSTVPGDYVAPLCAVQIESPRTKYTIAVTAAGIRAIWDRHIARRVVPPELVGWVCYYPWTPNLRRRSPATPSRGTSAR